MSPIAVVTGGSSGIGLDIALRLKAQGYIAIPFDLKPPHRDTALPYVECDVSDENAVKDAFETVLSRWGNCSLLVNNSGLQFLSPVETFPVEKWNQLIGVMLTGPFLCARYAIPQIKKIGKGRIVNISSIHGKEASPFKAAYVAAKHGLLGLTKVLALELAGDSITVNAICPGFVDTPLMRDQVKQQMELNNLSEAEVLEKVFLHKQAIKKLTTPAQVSEMVLYLASESASTITGEAFNISGGWGM